MPRYIEPGNPVGLALRGVIEGELLISGLSYEHVNVLVTAIEKRIQDGPADWLTLSDGTTFSKSWVPTRTDGTVEPVERWPEFGGKIDTNFERCPGCQSPKCPSCDPVQRAIDNIHAAHKQRVKVNTQKAQDARLDEIIREIVLDQDLADHDVWLLSLGVRRIITQ